MTPCPDQEILIKFTRGFPRRFSLLIRPQIKITFSFKCENSMDFLDNLGHCRKGGHTGSRAWVLVSRLLRHTKKQFPATATCPKVQCVQSWVQMWQTVTLASTWSMKLSLIHFTFTFCTCRPATNCNFRLLVLWQTENYHYSGSVLFMMSGIISL